MVPFTAVLSKATAATMATTKKTAPATNDSFPPATRGARMVVRRPTARSRTDGRVTRAMNRNTMGRA